jgi:hypothetical protein
MNKEEAKKYIEQMEYEKRLEYARKHPKENEDYKQMLKELEGDNINKYEKNYKHYELGIEEQITKSHPWGKGATEKYTPEEMVAHARKKGLSYKEIWQKLHAQVAFRAHEKNTHAYKVFKKAEDIAHKKAEENKEFKKYKIKV